MTHGIHIQGEPSSRGTSAVFWPGERCVDKIHLCLSTQIRGRNWSTATQNHKTNDDVSLKQRYLSQSQTVRNHHHFYLMILYL